VPLHQRLAEEGGLETGDEPRVAPPAEPPGFDGEPRGEPGIHGVPRARRFDVVTTARSDDLRGDAVHAAVLRDGTTVVAESDGLDAPPDAALAPLRAAVETSLARPYRLEAVRRGNGLWAVAARRIEVVAAPGLSGREAELVSTRDARTLHVDGQPRFGSVPAFETAGQAAGAEYVVHALHLAGDLWEVRAAAL
jgi:hypothetical protein